MVRAKYEGNAKNLDEGRGMISEQIATIEKEKDGFLLSKTNSPEHDHMTKSLRLFNAKLDMVLGKETAQKLSPEELEAVKNADIKALYDKAKEATFQYSCKKTKFGKGSILHEDGRARNRAARNTFELLSQMGGLLGLSDAAARMKEETALDVLENRESKNWEKTNAEDCAAKTIYALSMMHGNMSDGKQEGMLSESAMNRNLKKIKQRPEFRQMVKDLGPAGLCEAIVKGDDTLTLAYANAAKKLKDPQAGKGKPVVEMTAEQQREFWAKESQEPGEAKKQNPTNEDIPIV